MDTLHDTRYILLISKLQELRKVNNITQKELAHKLKQPQSYIAKVEGFERRLDLIELIDWLSALGSNLQVFLPSTELMVNSTSIPALPIPSKVNSTSNGIVIFLSWQGHEFSVNLDGITAKQYLDLEHDITKLYQSLNVGSGAKNREVICEALQLSISRVPDLNPSDIYHHIVYRLYLREYSKTQADRSWVRAGGEALELFVENHYTPLLQPYGISINALLIDKDKFKALEEMDIANQVGNSKLDIALYGVFNNKRYIFGGIHIKASLAERVSDDVPCSQSMMNNGYTSFLFTFDAKSFPPPAGDLVNRGELGTPQSPSDKRNYVEHQGLFDACFSYNTRTVPSLEHTFSGKRIYVGTFKVGNDPLPSKITEAWEFFKRNKLLNA